MTSSPVSVGTLAWFPSPFLTPQDSVGKARHLFQKYPHLLHLPLISEEKRYLGLLPKKALRKAEPHIPLELFSPLSLPPLSPSDVLYEALQKMKEYKVFELPIAGEDGEYRGLLTLRKLAIWWSQLAAVREPGTVVILEMPLRDYSLAEIASILESDEIRILSAYILPHENDFQKIYIVLKVNTIYLTRSLSLLERKGYKVVATHGDSLMERQAREQLAALLRYLDI
ncbi:MAG: CBS domain-containing protein [Bacteroidia bacterium]|nr:CBS domain-containing protein [Bacteroidia bacterium]MDW8014579.1 CBS domain-containing protein [Bacteroidia bacterium]